MGSVNGGWGDSGRRLGVEGEEVDAGCWVRIGEQFGGVWRSLEV